MPIRYTKDNRTIRTGGSYTEWRHSIFAHQEERCRNCRGSVPFWLFEVHHNGGRGMGGSLRDDVAWFEISKATGELGKCEGLCGGLIGCHEKHSDKLVSSKLKAETVAG